MSKNRQYKSLQNNTIFQSEVSDHLPLVQGRILNWNVMMQGRQTSRGNFNNGFGLIETQREYQHRLEKVVSVIDEIMCAHPGVAVLTLQEAPIAQADLGLFKQLFSQCPRLRGFTYMLNYDPDVVTPWGVMTLVDTNFSNYKRLKTPLTQPELIPRVQIIQLWNHQDTRVVNIHVPHAYHDEAEKVDDLLTKVFSDLRVAKIILAGDFNVDPIRLKYSATDMLTKLKNNIQLVLTKSLEPLMVYYENVDAILTIPPRMSF